MTGVSVLDAVAAEIIAVENDEHDESMTEEQLSDRYKNSHRTGGDGGGVGGGLGDEGLKQVPQSCVKMLLLQELATKNVDLCSERAARNVESRGNEIRKCVQLVMLITERMNNGKEKVEHCFACQEARIDPKMAFSGVDIVAVDGRSTDIVMMKFNEEYKRNRKEEDKHTIKNYESWRTWAGVGHGGMEGKEIG